MLSLVLSNNVAVIDGIAGGTICCPITAVRGREDETIASSANNWDVFVIISRMKHSYRREIRLYTDYSIKI
jgi:hypothetical protein